MYDYVFTNGELHQANEQAAWNVQKKHKTWVGSDRVSYLRRKILAEVAFNQYLEQECDGGGEWENDWFDSDWFYYDDYYCDFTVNGRRIHVTGKTSAEEFVDPSWHLARYEQMFGSVDACVAVLLDPDERHATIVGFSSNEGTIIENSFEGEISFEIPSVTSTVTNETDFGGEGDIEQRVDNLLLEGEHPEFLNPIENLFQQFPRH